MGDLDAERIYDERSDADTAHLATGEGVATVSVSNARVGRFRLDHRCVARDVAASRDAVAVATDEDVLVRFDGESFEATGFGPATAVGFDGDALVAASEGESVIGRRLHVGEDPEEWLTVADVDAPVTAIDGEFVAAGDGVYRLGPDAIEDVGLEDVRDVAAGGTPLAATGDGLYRLGNGWLRDLEGAFDAVASGDGHALAVGEDGTFERSDGEWRRVEVPERPVDVAVGQRPYAVTAEGTFMAAEEEGWRTRSLGLPDTVAMVLRPGGTE